MLVFILPIVVVYSVLNAMQFLSENKVLLVDKCWCSGLLLVLTNLMFALPLILPIHTAPIASFYSEYLAAFGGLLIIALFTVCAAYRLKSLHLAWQSLPLLLLIAVLLTQIYLSYYAYPANAYLVLAYVVLAILMLNLGRNQAAHHGVKRALCYVLPGVIMAGGLNLLAAVLQKNVIPTSLSALVMPLLINDQGAYGNLAQQNHFADLQALSCLSALYWFEKVYPSRRLRYALTISFTVGLLLSGARSALLYGLIILWYLNPCSLNLRSLRWSWLSLIAMVPLFVVCYLLIHLPDSHWQRYLQFNETLGARGFLWRHALAIVFEYPWLGVGFEGFAYHLLKQIQNSGELARWGIDQYAHNLVLQLAANAGLPWVAITALLLYRGWYAFRQQINRPGRRLVVAMLMVILLHSLIEQPIFYLYFLLPAAYLVGTVDSSAWRFRFKRRTAAMIVALGGFVLAILLLFKVGRDYFQVENLTQNPDWLSDQAKRAYLNQHFLLLNWRTDHSFPGMLEALYPQVYVAEDANIEAKLDLNLRLLRYAPTAPVVYRHVALLAQYQHSDLAQTWLRSAVLAYPDEIDLYLPRFRQLCLRQNEIACVLQQQLLRDQARVQQLRQRD